MRPSCQRIKNRRGVFQMSDYEWWLAHSLDEAKADYMNETGSNAEDCEDARELTAEELDTLEILAPDDVPRTFRRGALQVMTRSFPSFKELEQRLKFASGPEMFASTDE
jgi:hypothetical protein